MMISLLVVLAAASDAGAGKSSRPRTAVYDISAGVVAMPSGARLTAHSGMRECRDLPACAARPFRGPTPPGTYRLRLRPGRFYGERVLDLEPVDPRQTHGRSGLLAHGYLGMGGDSLGCVAFERYADFLAGFLRGEVDEIVIIPGDAASRVLVLIAPSRHRRHRR